MRAKLVVVGGDAKAAEIQLKLPTIVGRGRNATLTLPHPLVSRQHCEIVESDGQLLVRDLGSMNGTFIGNERISEAVLPPGELLTIGTVTFRAVYDEPIAPPGRRGQADVETLPEAASRTVTSSTTDEEVQFDSVETEPLETGLPTASPAAPQEDSDRSTSQPTEREHHQSADRSAEAALPDEDLEPGLFDDLEDDIVHDDSSEEFHLGEAPVHDEAPGDRNAENARAGSAGAGSAGPGELDAVEVAELDAPELADSELSGLDELDEVETIDAELDVEDVETVNGIGGKPPSPPDVNGPPASARPTIGPPATTGDDPQAPFAPPVSADEGTAPSDNANGDEHGQDADDELKSFLRGLN